MEKGNSGPLAQRQSIRLKPGVLQFNSAGDHKFREELGMEETKFWCNHEKCRHMVTLPTKSGIKTVSEHIELHAHLDKYGAEFWELWEKNLGLVAKR